jgi:hypothetical protein
MGRDARVNGWSWRDRKVVLGYPCGGSVTVPFHASCLRMLGYEFAKPEKDRLLVKMMHASGLYVGDNRMTLVDNMLEGEANWLLQVDTDIEFPEDLLERMLAVAGSERKIVAASVPLGQAYPTCGFRWTGQPGIYESVPIGLEPVEVDAIATACVLIHRDVFDAIADQHGQSWFHAIHLAKSPPGTPPRDFAYVVNGEDIAFSMRAKAAGFRIWCVHLPGLGHYKTRRLSHDDDRSIALGQSMPGMGVLVQEN